MSTDSISGYHNSLQVVKKELSILSDNPKAPLASAKFQTFLYESIGFLNTLSSGAPCVDQCQEWFSVVSQALEVLVHMQEQWDAKRLSHQNILTYLSHYLYHLMKVSWIPVDWYLQLGSAALEFLAAYSLVQPCQQDFIAKLASNVYGCLYTVAQNLRKGSQLDNGAGKTYELLFLACSVQCMDLTNKNRDGLKSAKEFLNGYVQQLSPSGKCSQSEVISLFALAVQVFTLQPRDIQSEGCLSYFIDLFRLVLKQRPLCEELLACEGNLFKLELPKTTSHFPSNSLDRVMHNSRVAILEMKENPVQDVIMSVMKFTFHLSSIIDSTGEGSAGVKTKGMKQPANGLTESNFMKEMHFCIQKIQEFLSESQKPVSVALSDSLAVLACLKLDPKSVPSVDAMLFVYELMSLCVEVFVKDVLYRASKDSQASFVSVRVYCIAVSDRTRIAFTQALLNQDLSDTMSTLAQFQKSSINALCVLAQAVTKKNILACYPNGKVQVSKSLEDSVSALGSFGRQLRRQEKYSEVIDFLSPLWPMPSLEELIPHISHHESLAECFRLTSQPGKVYQILAVAAKLSPALLQEPLLKCLIRLAKQETNLPILKIFDCCKGDEQKHAQILGKVSRAMLTNYQGLHRCTAKVLECLSSHPGLSPSDQAMYSCYLAEVRWYAGHESQDKKPPAGELHESLKASVSVLMSEPSQKYDDVVVQSAFLYWEMLHRYTCLEKTNTAEETVDLDTTPTRSPPNNTPLTPSEPPISSLEPQTPLDAAGSPRRAQSVNRLVFTTPVSRAKCKQMKERQKDYVAMSCQVDSDVLVHVARDCLSVWVQWFDAHKDNLLAWEDGRFRASRSLSFLNKVAEVARVNHNMVTALQATCFAKNLASRMNDAEAVRRLTARLLSVLGQLGIRYDDGSHPTDSSEKDLFVEDDIFFLSLGIGPDAHVLDLVSVAEYYFKVGEIHRFVQVCDVVMGVIERCREKGALTASTSTALSIIRRLSAELHSTPQVQEHCPDHLSLLHENYPTMQIGDSVKYIASVAMFYLGKDYKNVENRDLCEDSWHVIHEYLCTLKLVGELFLYIGNVKYAKTHFTEGLRMAKSCLLVTWSALFLSKLTQVALNYYTTTTEAENFLKRSLNLLERYSTVLPDEGQSPASLMKYPMLNNDHYMSGFHKDPGSEESCSLCIADQEDLTAQRGNLMSGHGASTNLAGRDGGAALLCHRACCDRCFQATAAETITELMWHQAEIHKRKEGPGITVLQSLKTAYCTAERIRKSSYRETVCQVLSDSGSQLNITDSLVNRNYEWTLETDARLAELYFHWMYTGDLGIGVTVEEVQKFLDHLLQTSKQALSTNRSNVLIASAQLLRIHLKYLPVLQGGPEEKQSDCLVSEESVSDEKVVEAQVAEVKSFMSYWDAKRTLEFVSPFDASGAACNPGSKSDQTKPEASNVPGRAAGKGRGVVSDSTPFLSSRPTPSTSQTAKRAAARRTYKKSLFVFDDSESSESAGCKSGKSTENTGHALGNVAGPSGRESNVGELDRNSGSLTKKQGMKMKAVYPPRTKTVPPSQDKLADRELLQMSEGLQNMHITSASCVDTGKEEGFSVEVDEQERKRAGNRKRQSPVASSKTQEVARDSAQTFGEEGRLWETLEAANAKKPRTGRSTRQKKIADVEVDSQACDLMNGLHQRGTEEKQNGKREIDEVSVNANKIIRRRRKIADEPEEGRKFAADVVLHEIDNTLASADATVASTDTTVASTDTTVASLGKAKREVRARKAAPAKGKENAGVVAPRRGGRRQPTSEVESPESERGSVYSALLLNDSPLASIVSGSPIFEQDEMEEKLELERSLLLRDSSDDFLENGLPFVAIPQTVETCYSPIEIPRGRKKCQAPGNSGSAPSTKPGRKAKGKAEECLLENYQFDDKSLIISLENSLKKLQVFPHSFIYSQISRCLAAEEFNSQASVESKSKSRCDEVDQNKIAARLTDSLHVTFRHLMIRNLSSKLRKCNKSKVKGDKEEPSDWSELQGEELTSEVEAMTEALGKLKTIGDVSTLCSRLSDIPKDWTVVQMTVVNFDPLNPGKGQLFVTRMTPDQGPLTLEIPQTRWMSLMRAVRVYESAIIHHDKLSPEQYWAYRYQKDNDMQNLVFYLQEAVLAGHKWLMRGRVNCGDHQATVDKLLEKAAANTIQLVGQEHGYRMDANTLRVVLEVTLCAHEQDVESLVQSVWPEDVAQSVTKAVLELQAKLAGACGEKMKVTRGPVVLLLDKTLNKFPWESMLDFALDTMTRMPSLATLQAFLTLHRVKGGSGFRGGVDRGNVVAVIDPETNLNNAVNVLLPQLEGHKGWTCLSQKAPTVADLKNFLTSYALYLYCGHGWGNQFVGGDDLQMFHARAVAVLMGCQSGRLDYKPRVDGDGGPLYFLLAGCPSVVGNLWLVTDKDIDKLTTKWAAEWMSQKRPVPMSQLLAVARKVCKLIGLNGFAPVIYGLPVLMNC